MTRDHCIKGYDIICMLNEIPQIPFYFQSHFPSAISFLIHSQVPCIHSIRVEIEVSVGAYLTKSIKAPQLAKSMIKERPYLIKLPEN